MPRVLSEEEAFAPAPQTTQPKQPRVISEEEAFGPAEPAGFLDYAKEIATSFLGAPVQMGASSLQGAAAASSNRPTFPEGQTPLDLAMRGDPGFAEQHLTGVPTGPPRPVTEDPVYAAGTAIRDVGAKYLGPSPGWENSWTRDISGGFGSVGTGIGVSLLSPAAAMLMFATGGQGEAAERAVKAGATPEQVQLATRLGTGAGALDVVDALLPHLGSSGRAIGFIKKVGLPVIAAALAEGGQEGLQQFIQNAIAKGIYKPDQDLMEDVPRNAIVGAIVGGGVKGLQNTLLTPTQDRPPTAEEIALVQAGAASSPPPAAGTAATPMGIDEILKVIQATVPGAGTPAGPVVNPTDPAAVKADLDQRFPIGSTVPDEAVFAGPRPSEVPLGTIADQLNAQPTFWPASIGDPPPGFQQPPDAQVPPDPEGLRRVMASMPQLPAPLEGEILPPVQRPDQVGADIVDFVHRNDPPLTVPEKPLTFSELFASRESRRVKMTTNASRMADLLSSTLYGSPKTMASVTVKEIMQNSFDGIKGLIESNPEFKGNIDIKMDYANRMISVQDNGTGMTSETLGGPFLQVAGTKKETKRASGGLGIAKMMFLLENQMLNVVTARDGKISTLITSGRELRDSLDTGEGAEIQTRKFTNADLKDFPQGHGTKISVQVPETFVDPSTGETKKIDFPDYISDFEHHVLKRSPLFDDIDVKFNGEELPIGNRFPIENYTSFANINFEWGTARVYVTNGPKDGTAYAKNLHVLSNGLWQFSLDLPADPMKPYGEKINKTIYVDVNSKAEPGQPGYPFALNRQDFSATVKEDFGKIFKYIQLSYQQEAFNVSVENFGTMQFLEFDQDLNTVKATGEKKLQPPEKVKSAATPDIKGKTVSVKDGKLVVDGKEVPELDPEKLSSFKIDVSRLRIPQSEIDPNAIILHDNTLVPATGTPLDAMALKPTHHPDGRPMLSWEQEALAPSDGMPKISLSQLAADKFGARFYEFSFLMGGQFRLLRDIVAEFDAAQENDSFKTDYKGLKGEGIGISFDPEYRGVSIRVPFSASFLNIAIPLKTDPAQAAVGMTMTMVHELAHHVHRSEDGLAPVMQEIFTQLDLHPTFNFQKFKQRTINILASYQDVFQFLNGAYANGLVTTGGKRFSNASSEPGGDADLSGDVRESLAREAGGYRLSDWAPLGQSATGVGGGRADAGATVVGAGSGRDPSFGKNTNQSALDGEPDPLTGRSAPGQRGPDADQFQPELAPSRQAVRSIFGGSTPKPVAAMIAHADRMNRFYKWMAGLTQLTDANPDFVPLVTYTETVRMMHSEEAQIHDAATRIGKDWRSLGTQSENLTAFLHDLVRMTYLTPQEAAAGVERHPTPQERQNLIDKHKLSGPALKVYAKVDGLFKLFIDRVIAVQIEKSIRGMTDPIRMQEKADQIRTAGLKLKERPYFPFMNFGRHFVTVKNAAGDTTEFYTFERSGLYSAERKQQAALRKIQKEVAARGLGEVVSHGIIPEAADPFVGMPPQLLEAIKTNLQLSPQQLDALDQMRLQSTSSVSFKTRFMNRGVAPGYSMDFKRAFAKYFFHGARYYARTKYAASLRDRITEAQAVGGNKASMIAEYMSDHLDKTVLDAKGDHGIFKGAIFLWAMGYVPAAALQNTTQTPMITYPFLWGKFGSYSAGKAITKALTNLNSFYKKGTYEGMVNSQTANFEMRAIDYGIKSGRVSETQSAELAGLSQGEGLIKGIAGNWASERAVMFQEKAAWMFEMAEQFNRRIAYRAGLYLGQTQPNSKEVQVAIKKYAQEYLELQASPRNFTEAEAKAIITAIHVTEQTQYVYARYARPRFMRGKIPGTVFVFKQYMQSTLMMMARNKSDVMPRMLFIWLLMGGLAAFPGWEDFREIIKGVARWRFGKDFDIEKELRKAIMDYTESEVGADLALHGFARKGFGVPAILDFMGSLYTGKPGRGLTSNTPGVNVSAPVIDMSRSISMGSVLPAEFGKMIAPGEKPASVIGDQTQKASGAAFSVAFNMYKAMWDPRGLSDTKRWEKAVPRALAMTSRAFRAYDEGRERATQGGPNSAATVVNYDVGSASQIRDTEHLMEILAIGMGFQTERVSSRWDRMMAQYETTSFYDLRRKGLLSQFYEAYKGGNDEEAETMRFLIRQFNDGLPDYARGFAISPETMVRSVKARDRALDATESGIPTRKAAQPIGTYLDELYPSVPKDMRRVR